MPVTKIEVFNLGVQNNFAIWMFMLQWSTWDVIITIVFCNLLNWELSKLPAWLLVVKYNPKQVTPDSAKFCWQTCYQSVPSRNTQTWLITYVANVRGSLSSANHWSLAKKDWCDNSCAGTNNLTIVKCESINLILTPAFENMSENKGTCGCERNLSWGIHPSDVLLKFITPSLNHNHHPIWHVISLPKQRRAEVNCWHTDVCSTGSPVSS